jgi:hypothetical protein
MTGSEPATTYYARLGTGGKDRFMDPYQVLRRVHTATGALDELLGPDARWRGTDVLARMDRGELPGYLDPIEPFVVDALLSKYREEFEVQAGYLRRQAQGGFALRLAVPAQVARDTTGQPVPDEPLSTEDCDALVRYLTSAPLVTTRPDRPDTFDPTRTVTADIRTDGRWVWSTELATLADRYRLPLEPEFAQHIHDRRYLLPDTIHPDVLRRAAALLHTAATTPPGQRVREQSAPGQPPAPTPEQRQQALSDWHQEWQERHASTTPFRPEQHADDSDYNQHHVDFDADADAETEYWRRADEIMGIDHNTGRRIDD